MLTVDDFKLIQVDDGFILVNTHKYYGLVQKHAKTPDKCKDIWKRCHTHLKSQNIAMIIRDNVISKKLPRTHNVYLLYSHIRVSEDITYQAEIELLIETRRQKGKKRAYYDRRKCNGKHR